MNKIIALSFAIGMVATTSALALDAKVAKDSTAPAEASWAAVGDFCAISTWHPAVEKCVMSEKDGTTFRTLTLKGGGTILEKQLTFDKAKMSYSYTIEESPLPVANYKSTLRVVPKDKGSTIEWSGTFDAKGAPDADAVKVITGIYDAGVSALAGKAK